MLQRFGAWTRAASPQVAIRQIQELAHQIVTSLATSGMPIPQDILVSNSPLVSVTTES
jgi:predicted RNase H-like HicB family nuclease